MPQNDNYLAWTFNSQTSFVPIFYQGEIVGFCKADIAARMTEFLNAQEKIYKALRLSCLDYIRKSGGDTLRVEELMRKYIARAERPKYGSRAIAAMLRDRQIELNVSDREFIRFCETYKLSFQELKEIYAGEEIIDSQLGPISRILGMSIEELIQIRDGVNKTTE
ncbi:MAG: hypothetical protein N3E45_09890 [Oscillatoriaceae bacterium SKW80]|nr:hypothetical protein [Oscillatoriaceae bacterium SKYG93]MCX8121126.1 hypothetical protein [Oscillatoriaceae bacterium SKW80]MDW8453544.1 hypothetical protein [Oscillatoriaceae cyanobacterium SKYGB_i_bin93]HIK26895.1 hypothetical protein [Oscillatoriaceae cyanobacterium M7585_C2015_266]